MAQSESYQPKQFNLSRLHGISDQTLEMHFKPYEGCVKEPNRLTEKIWDFLKDGPVDQEEMPAYSELSRRLGCEYNGMVLHEYYFGKMLESVQYRSGKIVTLAAALANSGFIANAVWTTAEVVEKLEAESSSFIANRAGSTA
jgi:hypothetical protein